MSFLKKLWGSQKQKMPANENAYTAFWQWFQQHQQHFHHIVDQGSKTEIERDFFDRLTPELEKVHSGIFFLTGMMTPQTAELILTPRWHHSKYCFCGRADCSCTRDCRVEVHCT